MANDAALDDGIHLVKGSTFTTRNFTFTVGDKIGEGGFGAVYCMQVTKGQNVGSKCAMKVEQKTTRGSKLKMEVAILRELHNSTYRHFAKIVDCGRNSHFNYLVMTLVGHSLSELKRRREGNIFSLSTALQVGKQCLEAIEDLHKIGYIHRDIKPGNFTCGLGRERNIVFLLDFGISRSILNNDGQLKTPRIKVNFKGTVRYAARHCHQYQELGRSDDCESWYYMLMDCAVPGGVPWKNMREKAEVLKAKEELRTPEGNKQLQQRTPIADYLSRIITYIDSRQYADKIDYQYLRNLIDRAARIHKVDLTEKLDWELDQTTEDETTTMTIGGCSSASAERR